MRRSRNCKHKGVIELFFYNAQIYFFVKLLQNRDKMLVKKTFKLIFN